MRCTGSLCRKLKSRRLYGWVPEEGNRCKSRGAGRLGPEVVTHAYVVPSFPKVLISDTAIKPLGIWVVDEARGTWCFGDELLDVLQNRRKARKSVE
jgi:hypothetical protein